ncbi:hypothetical protein ACO0LG_08545 [Undibacterium sp. Ji42W]|uniref:hypothetical protein n=1 Tax=Undibacterium sp. Ji42W TaxID=3413039 RepID=UPI003BF1C9EC
MSPDAVDKNIQEWESRQSNLLLMEGGYPHLPQRPTLKKITQEQKQAVNQDKLDNVYTQRNTLVVAFALAMEALGHKVGRGFDDDKTKDWADEWRHVVYVELPDRSQISWHIAPKDLPLLDMLPEYEGKWDGTFVGRSPEWLETLAE